MTSKNNQEMDLNQLVKQILETIDSVNKSVEAVETCVEEIRDKLYDFVDETQYSVRWLQDEDV